MTDRTNQRMTDRLSHRSGAQLSAQHARAGGGLMAPRGIRHGIGLGSNAMSSATPVAVRHPLRPARWIGVKNSESRPERADEEFAGRTQDSAPHDVDPPASSDTQAEKLARLLAVLFLAREPLNSRKLSQYSSLADGTEARTLVSHLNRQLDSDGRAFRVEPVAGGYQLVTRPKFAKWLRRLDYLPAEVRLSAPAMETLAVVAYQQPVVRADVEAIRGVSCGEVLSQLLERDLIRIGGRADELGRPYLYQTTKRFLQVFGLRSLEQLPANDAPVHGASDNEY